MNIDLIPVGDDPPTGEQKRSNAPKRPPRRTA